MHTTPDSNPRQPILLRLALTFGRPFGAIFVPELHVQVIRRMGLYAGVRGPGLTRHDPWAESLGPLVFVGGQRREYTFSRLISRDGLPFNARVSILYGYDPRTAPDLAPMLTRLSTEMLAGLTGTYLEWALHTAVNKHQAAQVTSHEVRARIEAEVKSTLDTEMSFLGIAMRGDRPIRVLRVEPPPSLIERHETIAQRRESILAGTEFHPAEYRRALVTEFIEHLAKTGAGESIINFNDVLESYLAERRPGGPIIDGTASPGPRQEPPAPPKVGPRPRL